MADKRMPADTARQMIESEKRKLQKQAVPRVDPGFDLGQEAFMQEMEEAEAKGDLPPATVEADSLRTEVIRSMKGGETPAQAEETYSKVEDAIAEKRRAARSSLSELADRIAPNTTATVGVSDLSSLFTLISDGKVTLNDPELQQEAVEKVNAVRKLYKSEGFPEGRIPLLHEGGLTPTEYDIRGESAPLREAIKKGELE
tara:strand:- start:151 stop:750 length:600 start_codon:yes stop_codon:yes gene_type:complete